MKIKVYFSVISNKIKAIFRKRLSFSATIFNSFISKKSAIKQKSRLYNCSMDDYSYVGRNCLLQNTKIGKFCSVSDNCNIGMPAHPTDYVSTSPVFLKGKNILSKNFSKHSFSNCKETNIGNDVWIGANVLIKSGIAIGDGSIIGAGSVLTHNVPPYEIWAGNPAKLLRKRFDDNTIEKLLEIKWWEWEDKKMSHYSHMFNCPRDFLQKVEK